MTPSNYRYSAFIDAIQAQITQHGEQIAALDQAIGDGDHLINLQRGLKALNDQLESLDRLDLSAALSQTGMTLMSTMGGASGSLYGSLFVAMGQQIKDQPINLTTLAAAFNAGVASVKARGKADIGEKTMLDTLIPVASELTDKAAKDEKLLPLLEAVKQAAETGMQSTKAMLATKGRASFLGERARGHIDPGARTSQLIITAIADVLVAQNA